jgi:hypothetical protein
MRANELRQHLIESWTLRDLNGLKAIAELNGIRCRVVVFLGERPFRTEDGIDALPVEEFLRELAGNRI